MRKSMRAINRTGEANPGYKHGRRTGLNIRGWDPKAKGETCCRWCGATSILHLHHAIPRSICPPEAKRDLRNGITLCNHCHPRWHKGTLTLPRAIFTGEEWAYISGLRLEGRNTAAWLDKHYPLGSVTREQQLRQMALFRAEAVSA